MSFDHLCVSKLPIQAMNIRDRITQANRILINSGKTISGSYWQSVQSKVPMYEVCNLFFDAPMPETKEELRLLTAPDMPWAEDHFQERVGGEPLNPGEQYKNWPYYDHSKDNDRFREGDKQFSHSYMERYWPPRELKGIRYNYGL